MIDLWSLLLAWGAFQGAFLGTTLLGTRRGMPGVGPLTALLYTLAALVAELLAIRLGVYAHAGGLIVPLLTPLTFAIGPLLVLHARALGGRPTVRDLVLFAPAAAASVNLMPAYRALARTGPLTGPTGIDVAPRLVPVSGYLELGLFGVFTLGCALLARRHLGAYARAVREETARSRAAHVGALALLGTLTGGIGALAALAMLVFWVSGAFLPGFELAMALALSLVVHALGVLSIRHPDIFARRVPARIPRTPSDPAPIARLRDRLVAHMGSARPYLDPELSRTSLARDLGITPHRLSQVLSEGVGESFFDFVNRYRVEEVKRRLRDPESRRLTTLALALESGFASKSSFNRVFKRLTGETPSGWARRAAAAPPPVPARSPDAAQPGSFSRAATGFTGKRSHRSR